MTVPSEGKEMATVRFTTIPCEHYTAIKFKEINIFVILVSGRFEDLRSFLCTLMSVVNVFVRYELWVYVAVAILYCFGGLLKLYIICHCKTYNRNHFDSDVFLY